MKYTFTLLFLFLVTLAGAQDYKNSVGFRIGNTDGPTYKRFLTENGAVELMLGFGGDNGGMQLYTTYQWNYPLPNPITENLFLYYGVGGHIGYIRPQRYRNYYINDSTVVTEDEKQTYYTIGVDGVIGLEYRIFTVPMTVSTELKPAFEYYGLRYTQFNFWDFGITVKYIF